MKNNTDEWGILELQSKILDIAVFIHELCKKNNIQYYLMGGTALGAIRNNGFIPWDDDLDIFMTVEEYEKFKKIFPIGSFYLQEWGKRGNKITMAKVRDSRTTLIEDAVNDWDINHGVYVDIFLLHKAAPTTKKIKKQELWARYLITKGLSLKTYRTKSLSKMLLIYLLKLTPKHFLQKHALDQLYKYDSTDSFDYYFHFIGRAGLFTGLYEKSLFCEPTLVDFEKTKLFAPTKLKDYVIKRWGDNYMTPPTIEQIRHMQHQSIWDINVSYLDFKRDKINKRKNENLLIL